MFSFQHISLTEFRLLSDIIRVTVSVVLVLLVLVTYALYRLWMVIHLYPNIYKTKVVLAPKTPKPIDFNSCLQEYSQILTAHSIAP